MTGRHAGDGSPEGDFARTARIIRNWDIGCACRNLFSPALSWSSWHCPPVVEEAAVVLVRRRLGRGHRTTSRLRADARLRPRPRLHAGPRIGDRLSPAQPKRPRCRGGSPEGPRYAQPGRDRPGRDCGLDGLRCQYGPPGPRGTVCACLCHGLDLQRPGRHSDGQVRREDLFQPPVGPARPRHQSRRNRRREEERPRGVRHRP